MLTILTVCTGNICRSPLAAQLLQARLTTVGVAVSSAGTHGLDAAPMTREAQHLATALGVADEDAARHRSRYLTAEILDQPDLILAMTREHRRSIVELAPTRMRSTFTIREFARVGSAMTPEALRAAADTGGEAPASRLRAAVLAVAAYRGVPLPLDIPEDDDVIDPYRQSWEIYKKSATQLLPAVEAAASLIRLATTPD